MSVAIVVEEAGAGAPFSGPARDAGGRRHVGERAVAVVVEDVRTERRHVEVEETVPVVVANRDAGLVCALTGAFTCDSRLPCHVDERTVVVVVVQRVRGPGAPLMKNRS